MRDNKPKNIFLIDDDDDTRSYMKELLEYYGYFVGECECASSALELFEKIQVSNFHLIIVDVFMKGINGIDFVQLIRKDYPDLPILVVSGNSRSYLEERFDFQAFHFMQKPVRMQAFIDMVSQLLSDKITV